VSVAFSLVLFGVGVALLIWATARLLEGLVGLATFFFARGRVGRLEGAALLCAYALYATLRAFYI
jgi:hypothetical protein